MYVEFMHECMCEKCTCKCVHARTWKHTHSHRNKTNTKTHTLNGWFQQSKIGPSIALTVPTEKDTETSAEHEQVIASVSLRVVGAGCGGVGGLCLGVVPAADGLPMNWGRSGGIGWLINGAVTCPRLDNVTVGSTTGERAQAKHVCV